MFLHHLLPLSPAIPTTLKFFWQEFSFSLGFHELFSFSSSLVNLNLFSVTYKQFVLTTNPVCSVAARLLSQLDALRDEHRHPLDTWWPNSE